MSSFDLIPTAYRRARSLHRRALQLLACWGALGATALLATGALRLGARSLELEVAELERAHPAAEAQAARLAELEAEKLELKAELEALQAVRGSVAVRELLVAVDQALSRDVWFVKWRFERASLAPGAGDSAGERAAAPAPSPVRSDMHIVGRAADHSALAGFVKRLLLQPEIESARVNSTATLDYLGTEVVGFDLAIAVRGGRA